MNRNNLIYIFLLLLAELVYSGCPFRRFTNSRSTIDRRRIADPETSTPEGCTCNSLCKATMEDGFTKDWCTVEGSCGHYTPTWGYWDYCLYKDSSKPEYVALNWKTKHDQIWSEIKSDASFGDYYPSEIFTESLMTTFENEWDVLPAGRHKAIHGVGVVCPFTVDISQASPFTGLFKPGRQITGLIRMSWSSADFLEPLKPGNTPGVSVKFLRSGTSSGNLVMGDSSNDSHDFFLTPVSNHIPTNYAPDNSTMAISKRFCSTGHCISKVGLSNLCTHDQEGNPSDKIIFPFKVTFKPNVNFQKVKKPSLLGFFNQFGKIPKGTKFYTIKASQSPEDIEGFDLGEVVTVDDCVSSFFGDTKMFFKHQWIEEDIALRPEWSEAYKNECYCHIPLVL